VHSIPALEPSYYRLTLGKTGFKELVGEPIAVESSGAVQLAFNLTGAQLQQVFVVGRIYTDPI